MFERSFASVRGLYRIKWGAPRKVSDTIRLLSRVVSAESYHVIRLDRGREIDDFNVFRIENVSPDTAVVSYQQGQTV